VRKSRFSEEQFGFGPHARYGFKEFLDPAVESPFASTRRSHERVPCQVENCGSSQRNRSVRLPLPSGSDQRGGRIRSQVCAPRSARGSMADKIRIGIVGATVTPSGSRSIQVHYATCVRRATSSATSPLLGLDLLA
jgi:hypothetical protein